MFFPNPVQVIPSGEYAIVFIELFPPPTAIVGCCIYTEFLLRFDPIHIPPYGKILDPIPVQIIPSLEYAIELF